MLSLVLIGPVFFLLIETSITKGWKSAIALDAGVILADMLCIAAAYFGAKDLVNVIDAHPSLYKLGGFIIMVYGVFMFVSKPKLHINNDALVTKNYIKTFANGFIMNILNIGVVVFWFAVVSWVTLNYPKSYEFFLFIGVALTTFVLIDLSKIFLAKKYQERLTDKVAYTISKVVGIILVLFGLFIFLKGFGVFGALENKLPDIPFQ